MCKYCDALPAVKLVLCIRGSDNVYSGRKAAAAGSSAVSHALTKENSLMIIIISVKSSVYTNGNISYHIIAASKSKSQRESSSSDAGDFQTMDASCRKQTDRVLVESPCQCVISARQGRRRVCKIEKVAKDLTVKSLQENLHVLFLFLFFFVQAWITRENKCWIFS